VQRLFPTFLGVFDRNGSAGYPAVTTSSCWLQRLLHATVRRRLSVSTASVCWQCAVAWRNLCPPAAAARATDAPAVAMCRG